MRTGMPRQWATAVTVALVAGVAIGVPAGVVLTSFYARMAVVPWWKYSVWAVSSLLMSLLTATYVGQPPTVRSEGPGGRRALFAGVLSAFAVDCPICNQLIARRRVPPLLGTRQGA
ncbi:hypothetical protein OOK36_44825 [Streptomyces sp. NBC_00365]|uniref:hypothetical protein n=1 Tax=Streptomyces sp. NBC_00365 TaxID=2975726 RepID=UPI00224DD923|nr:hypothetical protein [Streptomyces sp. NBC_00365]MCX5095822.1 hypothetical protein [Streptomyces sp. NBC_00365]